MNSFNKLRSYLNHNVIKNTILVRLTDKIDRISACEMSREKRLEELSEFLSNRREMNNNIHEAISTWNYEPEKKKSVPDLVRDLCEMLIHLKGFKPTEKLNIDQINEWVDQVDDFLNNLEGIIQQCPPDQKKIVFGFWNSAINLHDLLHYLNPTLPEFLEYMEIEE